MLETELHIVLRQIRKVRFLEVLAVAQRLVEGVQRDRDPALDALDPTNAGKGLFLESVQPGASAILVVDRHDVGQ